MRSRLAVLVLFLGPPVLAETPRTDPNGDPLPAGAFMRVGTHRLRQERFNALVYSPDGQNIAYVGGKNPIRVCRAKTGYELQVLGPALSYQALAFSPDGALLASAQQQQVQLWNLATGQEVRRLQGHNENVTALSFAPNGRTLYSASYDGTVRAWDVGSGKLQRKLTGPKLVLQALAISPDGKTIAAGGDDKTLYLWDAPESSEPTWALPLDSDIRALAFAPDGKSLASGTWDGQVRLWELATLRLRETLVGHDGCVASVGFGPDGKTLYSGDWKGILITWRLATAEKRLREQPGAIFCLAVAPDGQTVIAAGGGPTPHFWEAATGQSIDPLPGFVEPIRHLAFAPGGKALIAVEQDYQLSAWDVATGKFRERRSRVELRKGQTLALTLDARLLARYEANDHAILISETEKGKQRHRLPLEESRPADDENDKPSLGVPVHLAVASDGRTLAAATAQGSVLVWQTDSTQRLAALDAPPGLVRALAFSADGHSLLTLDSNDQAELRAWEDGDGPAALRLWEVSSGRLRGKVSLVARREGTAIALAPDGQRCAVWDATTRLQLADFNDDKVRPLLMEEGVSTAAFSPDGRLLAAGTSSGEVMLWNAASGTIVQRFSGHRGRIETFAFALDGRTLASASADTTVLLWSLDGVRKKLPSPPTPPELSDRDLEDLWKDLGGDNAARAFWAQLRLARAPNQTVTFLNERLRPEVLDTDRIEKLIADLDSNRFGVRKKASDDLETLGSLAELSLRQALADKPGVEMRRRLEQLLGRLKVRHFSSEQLRSWRGVELLERIGTVEAGRVLEKLAQGTPAALLTEEARASRKRSAKNQ